MSWGYSTKRKCLNCGFEYNIEESTLSSPIEDYDNCPRCGNKSKIISNNSIDNEIAKKIEMIKNRRKPKYCSTL